MNELRSREIRGVPARPVGNALRGVPRLDNRHLPAVPKTPPRAFPTVLGSVPRPSLRSGRVTLALALLALLTLDLSPASAQTMPTTPKVNSLIEATRRGLLQTGVVSGRITVLSLRMRPSPLTAKADANEEHLLIRAAGNESVLTYVQPTPQQRITVEIYANSNRVRIRIEPQGTGTAVPVEFTQPAVGPLTLTVGIKGGQREYRGASLWHLFIAHGKVCRESLAPLLALIDARNDAAKMAGEIEEGLVEMARVQESPDRRRWDGLVAQLHDEKYARREAADRELRASGRSVLGYLQRLDPSRLDAEQKFRIRHIVAALAESDGIDTPDRVASWLAGDPVVWLGMLSHDSEPVRRLAARQLGGLLDRPIVFDPAAAEAVRQSQIEQIRTLLRE